MLSKRGAKPICFISEQEILVYRWGILYKFHLGSKSLIKLRIFSYIGILECICPLIFRLLRIGIRCGIAINDELILLSCGKKIYEYNIKDNKISKGFTTGRSRVLKFSMIRGIDNFDNTVVFGEYFGNPNKAEVHIYSRVACDIWQKVFTFNAKTITHIHNIVPDTYNNCVWIFTGDFGDEAGIWRTDDNFKTIEPILIGKQEYRACVGFATPEGLLYATDSPYAQNYIKLLFKSDNGAYQTKNIKDINGSSIYGCQCNEYFVFSTTVEPDGRNENLFNLIFNKERGNGILDDHAYLYYGNTNEGFNEIFKLKKDSLPYLFQFGTFFFPEGNNKTKSVILYPIALKSKCNGLTILDL